MLTKHNIKYVGLQIRRISSFLLLVKDDLERDLRECAAFPVRVSRCTSDRLVDPSTSKPPLQLARLIERVTRNFGDKMLTDVFFLGVAKEFDTVWVEGILYKLKILSFH